MNRGSNNHALKLAGLTAIVCLLLTSQVFMAYMVFNLKEQIHTLRKHSEDTRKQLTHRAQGNAPLFPALVPVQMPMPMNSVPLHDFTDDGAEMAKTPLTLPQFNKLQSLKKQMKETEWEGFESWMRQWLIFHTAQETPPAPQPDIFVMTKCQTEADAGPGFIKPQCDEQGDYITMQCWYGTGICWCVDESGSPIEGTAIHGIPDCQRALDHLMASSR